MAVLTRHLETSAEDLWRGASLGPTPDEVASTARETIPNMVRSNWLSPVRPFRSIGADAYAGPDYVSTSPDVFVLPGGIRAVCHMIPGVGVFLSDGSTFHYTLVASVDDGTRTITLADPWSGVSFLRRGFNQAGVAAEVVATVGGKPGLRLTFDEFARVFRGEIDPTSGLAGFPASITFDALARIYPEIADSEGFLVWRYSRMLARLETLDGQRSYAELTDRTDLEAKPGLGRLADAADILVAVKTNLGLFTDHRLKQITTIAEIADPISRQTAISAERQKIVALIPGIAKALPAVMLLTLLEDAAQIDDLELRLAITEAITRARPDDVEFLLAQTEALLALERYEDARVVLANARAAWTRDLDAAIAVPPGQALRWFEERSRKLRLVTFNLLHWQRARLSLLEAIADPASIVGSTEDWLVALGNNYAPVTSYGAPIDFLEESLWVAWRRGDSRFEQGMILGGLSSASGDEALARHLAAAVLAHARWRRGLRELLGESFEPSRGSFLHLRICELVAASEAMPRATDAAYLGRLAEIDEYCRP